MPLVPSFPVYSLSQSPTHYIYTRTPPLPHCPVSTPSPPLRPFPFLYTALLSVLLPSPLQLPPSLSLITCAKLFNELGTTLCNDSNMLTFAGSVYFTPSHRLTADISRSQVGISDASGLLSLWQVSSTGMSTNPYQVRTECACNILFTTCDYYCISM